MCNSCPNDNPPPPKIQEDVEFTYKSPRVPTYNNIVTDIIDEFSARIESRGLDTLRKKRSSAPKKKTVRDDSVNDSDEMTRRDKLW